MRPYFYIFFLLFSLYSYGQGFKVRHYLPGVKNHLSKAIFETTPGNYMGGGIIVDNSNSAVYCNLLCLTGLDAQGQILWTKKYGHSGFQYLNNPFIFRSFYKLGNFIFYVGSALDVNNKYLGVLIKLNLNGDTLWQKRYYDANDYVYPQMLTPSVDGGFLLTGMFEDPMNVGRRVLLIKTDANGNELWRKKISKVSPNVNDGKAIVQDSSSKKIAIVGSQYIGGQNVYDNILILDSLGIKISQHNYETVGGMLLDLIQTKDKKVVAAGVAYSSQTIGGTNLERSYLVKFDINNPSAPIWKINDLDPLALNNGFGCIVELANEDLLVSGFFDTLQMQNQNRNLLTSITRVNKNGTLLWKHYYNYKTNAPTSDNNHTIKSLNLTSNGGYVAAIECANTPNPNPFFFVKWDSLGCDSNLAYCQTVAMGVGKNYAGSGEISLYPNPTTGLFWLSTPGIAAGAELLLSVCDISGREIKKMLLNAGEESQGVNLRDLGDGIYMIRVMKGKYVVYTGKVLKQE